jgi:hypothetical protein
MWVAGTKLADYAMPRLLLRYREDNTLTLDL